MTTSQSNQPDEPPYGSYTEVIKDHGSCSLSLSPAVERLVWPLNGVFPMDIFVMKTSRSISHLDPFFQPDSNGTGGGVWHEIAQLPLTTRKVSCIDVKVRALGSRLQAKWGRWHEEHVNQEQEFVTYGDLSDEDRPYRDGAGDGKWEEDSDTEFLIKCCGEDRPMVKNTNLGVTPSAGGHFVTVHDYVSAVHPWLSSLRKDIMICKILADPEDEDTCQDERSFAATEWVVAYYSLTVCSEGVELEIQEKRIWIDGNNLGPPRTGPSPFDIQFMARLRAERERSGRTTRHCWN